MTTKAKETRKRKVGGRSVTDQTNGPVTERESCTLFSAVRSVNPDFCLKLFRKIQLGINLLWQRPWVLKKSMQVVGRATSWLMCLAACLFCFTKGFPVEYLSYNKLPTVIRFIIVRCSFLLLSIGHHPSPKTEILWEYGTLILNLLTWHFKRLSSLERPS